MSETIDFIDTFRKNGDIDLYLKQSIKDDDVELELVYGDLKDENKMLTKEQFLAIKSMLTYDTQFINLGETDSLDIRTEFKNKHKSFPSSYRLTIEGIDQIKSYCKNDHLESLNYKIINKLRYKDPKHTSTKFESIHSSEYPCRVNLKHELPIDNYSKEGSTFTLDWNKKNKAFRYKKRYSFLTQNKLWRLDITAVKQTKLNEYFKTFKQSKLLSHKEKFELEIEYVGNMDEGSGFSVPPIVNYAELVNDKVDDYNWHTPTGSFHNTSEGTLTNLETDELYLAPSSPRYDQGIEFDEPIDSPTTGYKLPDTITVKKDYWKETEQELLWEQISKDDETESYKFIPRKKVFQGDKAYVETELSPHLELDTGVISFLTIPVEYILEDVSEAWEDTVYEPGVAKSPRTMSGGGGDSLFSIDSDTYSKQVIDGLLTLLNELLNLCFRCIYQYSSFMTKSQEISIFKQYCKMTGQSYNPKWSFVGPQPVSMSVEHLNPYNPDSILSNYAVTEKADGIRAELLITEGKGYLITPKKRVINMSVSFDTPDDWIFDGEYITQNKQGEPIKLFMIFDVYYSSQSSSQPHSYPWYSKKGLSRSTVIHEFKQSVTLNPDSSDSVRVGFKEYYEGPTKLLEKDGKFKNLTTILKYSKKILDKEENIGGFEYFTDGLIFLPISFPVKGVVEGDNIKSIKGTWNVNYKWKPPEENTIDFKVIYMKDKGRNSIHTFTKVSADGRKSIEKYQKIQLVVGYKEKDDSTIDFNWYQLTKKPPNKQNYQYFNPDEYPVDNIHITNVPLINDKMICEKDKKTIDNGCIVEMRYDPKATNGCCWIPLRVRDDKQYPQYFKIANNIWNTINNPVTPEMIKGVVDFDSMSQELPKSEEYYVDTYNSDDSPIRHLHNYIKSKLISRIGSSPDNKGELMIADLSCGRGGDIKKYLSIKSKVSFILGLDISSNINEAAQRYYYLSGSKPKAMFLQFDTSKSIVAKEGCLGDKEMCDSMLELLFNKSSPLPRKYKQIQKEYAGLAKHGFDIVSSQFSVHYYFKNEDTLRGFCENVRDMCCSGGYFIGTCYDGLRLFNLFKSTESDVINMKTDTGSLIYQIKKLYDTPLFNYDTSNKERMFGQEIEVFMSSIGQPIIEYLVNFDFFIDIMDEYGFELTKLPKEPTKEYNPITGSIQPFDSIIELSDNIRENDGDFVKKTRNTDLYKVKQNPLYRQLSSLNNLFIFQKR